MCAEELFIHPSFIQIHFMKRTIRCLFVISLFLISSLDAGQRPKLVILISIDQMKAEHLEWYKLSLQGDSSEPCQKGRSLPQERRTEPFIGMTPKSRSFIGGRV